MYESLKELVGIYEGREVRFPDDDDSKFTVTLRDGLDAAQMDALQQAWPFPIPDDYRTLLTYCAGFESSPHEAFGFDLKPVSDFLELIPYSIEIAADGFGNYWLLELQPDGHALGPIWYLCHDAPVLLLQSNTLHDFIVETFKLVADGERSLVDYVHEDAMMDIWYNNPGLLKVSACRQHSDEEMREFAKTLDDEFVICDLRNAQPGEEFSWGRAAKQEIIRHKNYPIFAFQMKRSLLDRILGRNI